MIRESAVSITSEANERVKGWKKLASQPRQIRRERLCLAEGLHIAMSARDASYPVNALILRDGEASPEAEALVREITGAARRSGRRPPRLYLLAPAVYESIAPVEKGCGLMMELPLPPEPAADALRGLDALFLDGVQDPGNAGTLIRTAVASGVRVIAASPGTVELWSPKVLRSAMGAHFGAHILENVKASELALRFAGRRIAADARGGRDLYDTKGWESGPVVWLMGAEGPGLSQQALAAAELRLYIPIEPATESLNVAAAAAVCLFEQRRRRRFGADGARRG
ncbi:RNA methyltransferase [Mesosutterella sp. AGMB02718]|uniref:RNA methyltransferase n=1 Tax=Mesosutterella faecium TaxID=2925194 RepID=A0ABT7IMM8_9BURK|nr:RNA methyltransferase [Mesosutterella sp. AGMB02718]MDL2059636.1 RNA methyltransferase [Mesosutterella sp. AGMB02718]